MSAFSPTLNGNGRPRILGPDGSPYEHTRPDGADAPDPHGIALPFGWMFVGKFQGGNHAFIQSMYDEAMRFSRKDAESMRRDCALQAIMQERRLSVVGLNWHLEAPDDKDPYQARVKDGLTRLVKGIRQFRRMLWWWTDATWYGRYGVQVAWKKCQFEDRPSATVRTTTFTPGETDAAGVGGDKHDEPSQLRRGLTIGECWPVNGDKIGHQEDHTPFVLLNSSDASRLDDKAEVIITSQGRGLALRGTWRERFIIHKHHMDDPDFFAPERAEAVHGTGVRSAVFWMNYLRMEWLSSITNYFYRVGMGLTIWKYQAGNPQARAAVMEAAKNQSERANIFVPVSAEDNNNTGAAVERIETPTSGAEALLKLIEYADAHIERYIIGQEASSKGSSSGLGNEANAELQEDTKTQIIKHDAALLGETISGSDDEPGIINVMQRYSFPEADFPVKFVFDVETGESDKKLQAAKTLVEMGVKIRADDVLKAAGFGKPAEGDDLVRPMGGNDPGQMQPGGATGGDNPLAAMMGGAAPDAGGEQPQPDAGAPSGDFLASMQADTEAPEEPSGDFLESMKMAKRGRRIRAAVHDLRGKGRSDLALKLLQGASQKELIG